MKIQLILLSFCLMHFTHAQQDSIPGPPDVGLVDPGVAPVEITCLCGWEAEFPGGNRFIQDYVTHSFQAPRQITYYDEPREKVYLEFIVEKSGEIGDVQVFRGYSYELDTELIHVIREMPRWTPAREGCCHEIWDCSCCTLFTSRILIPVRIELK